MQAITGVKGWTCPKQVEVLDVVSAAGGTDCLKPIMQVQQPVETPLPSAQQWDRTRDEDLFPTAQKQIKDILKVFPRFHRLPVIYPHMQDELIYCWWDSGQNNWESVEDKVCVCTRVAVSYRIWEMDISDHGIANN